MIFFILCYILTIAIVDIYYNKNFIINDSKWRKTLLCQILGTITTLSTILGSISTPFITIERFLIVFNPIKVNFLSYYQK